MLTTFLYLAQATAEAMPRPVVADPGWPATISTMTPWGLIVIAILWTLKYGIPGVAGYYREEQTRNAEARAQMVETHAASMKQMGDAVSKMADAVVANTEAIRNCSAKN